MAIKELLQEEVNKIEQATSLLSSLDGRDGAYVWEQYTAQNGDFIGYAVADDANAYPDGGELDGYWYEVMKVVDEAKYVWRKNTRTVKFSQSSYNITSQTAHDNVPYTYGSGSYTVYVASSYSFNASTGLYTLASPTATTLSIGGTSLSGGLKGGQYMIVGSASGTKMYYNGNASSKAATVGWMTDGTYYRFHVTPKDSLYPITVYTVTDSSYNTPTCFVIENDSTAYPNGALHTDGYYYELYGSI